MRIEGRHGKVMETFDPLANNPLGEGYSPYKGPTNEQMPHLVADGLIPLSAPGFWITRLFSPYRSTWKHMSLNSGDGLARQLDGSLLIVPDCLELRAINPKTELIDGYIPLPPERYIKMDGYRFSPADVERYASGRRTAAEAVKNPILLAFCRNDESLLREVVYSIHMERVDVRDTHIMGISLPAPANGLWHLNIQPQPVSRSRVEAGKLNDESSEIVGIHPDSAPSPVKFVPRSLDTAVNDVKPAKPSEHKTWIYTREGD